MDKLCRVLRSIREKFNDLARIEKKSGKKPKMTKMNK